MPDSKQFHTYDYFIDEQGNWFCEGNPVSDLQLFRLLSRSLFEREGCYLLRCEGETHPVRVADAPLWVRYVHVGEDPQGNLAGVEIELQDGRRERLSSETLTVGENGGLYCLSTHRRLKTRFGKVAYYELTRHLQQDESTGQFYFIIAEHRFNIRSEAETA